MRPTTDEYFMDMARLAASRSTCARRSVGCVLVNARNHILATGYNGVAAGDPHCNEMEVGALADDVQVKRLMFKHACPGIDARSGQNLDACLAVHAEQNAILQCTDAYAIDRAYVTAFPCPSCAKLLLNTSCRVVVYEQSYGDDAGQAIWVKAGRIAQQFNGAPHMIQVDLVKLFEESDSRRAEGQSIKEWRVVVACVCLNLCSARAARGVIFRLLRRWSTPEDMARADPGLEAMLKPLGLGDRRADYLRRLSQGWAIAWPGITTLPGVGAYALDSVNVFCRGEIPENPRGIGDRKVAAWVHWYNETRRGRDNPT